MGEIMKTTIIAACAALLLAGCAFKSNITNPDGKNSLRDAIKVAKETCGHYKQSSQELTGEAKLRASIDYESCMARRLKETTNSTSVNVNTNVNQSQEGGTGACLSSTFVAGIFTLGLLWIFLPFCFL